MSNFEWALSQIKSGKKVRRPGWGCTYLELSPQITIKLDDTDYCAYKAEQLDMMSEDWELVEDE